MEKYYLAALAAALGYASPKVWALVGYFGSPRAAYAAKGQDVSASGVVQGKPLERFLEQRKLYEPEALAEYCYRQRITLITSKDTEYPENLRRIFSPPVVLYVQGQLPQKKQHIGIVGSRKATSYGKTCAEKFSLVLAAHDLVIVSGGAFGIDTAAHKGALLAKGRTIAVLGSGLQKLYPESNFALFEAIKERGALVTEFAPPVDPLPRHFPMRNRIIVGLSQGILVVEAAEKSGAVITANIALEENREVYALPGNITSPTSKGTNNLIKDGARLIDAPEEIIADLAVLQARQSAQPQQAVKQVITGFSPEETLQAQQVLTILNSVDGIPLEEIFMQLQIPLPTLHNLLLNLQIGGFIRPTQGHKYVRI